MIQTHYSIHPLALFDWAVGVSSSIHPLSMYYSYRFDFFSVSLHPTDQGLQNSWLFIAGVNSSSFPWLLLCVFISLHPLILCRVSEQLASMRSLPHAWHLCVHAAKQSPSRGLVCFVPIAHCVLAWAPVQSQPVRKPRIYKGEGNPEICRSQDFAFSFCPGSFLNL